MRILLLTSLNYLMSLHYIQTRRKIYNSQKHANVAMYSTLTQIPHPMHSSSEMVAILSFGVTSMQSFPIRTTGQLFLHSCLHLFGLQRSAFTIAIRVSLSVSSLCLCRDITVNTENKLCISKEIRKKFTWTYVAQLTKITSNHFCMLKSNETIWQSILGHTICYCVLSNTGNERLEA